MSTNSADGSIGHRAHPVGADPFRSGRVAVADGTIRFGQTTIPLASIRSHRIVGEEKSGLIGSICGFAVFLCIAALILEAIVGQIFPPRTLIGVATLGCVGLASVQDTWRETGTGFYRLMLKTDAHPGEIMVYASPMASEIGHVREGLVQAIEAGTTEAGRTLGQTDKPAAY